MRIHNGSRRPAWVKWCCFRWMITVFHSRPVDGITVVRIQEPEWITRIVLEPGESRT